MPFSPPASSGQREGHGASYSVAVWPKPERPLSERKGWKAALGPSDELRALHPLTHFNHYRNVES
jgi:hypothetical protein